MEDTQERYSKEKENIYVSHIEGGDETGAEKDNIKDLIEQLKKSTITHRNAKEFYEMVRNRNMMAETAVSNLYNSQKKIKNDLTNVLNIKTIKEMMELDKIVPIKVFELFSDMYSKVDEMLIYTRLQNVMLKILNKKLFDSLAAVKSLDIEREVTQGMREIQTEYMGIIKEIVTEKFRIMDTKLMAVQENNKREMDTFENTIYTKLIKDFERLNNSNVLEIKNLVVEFNNNLKEVYDKKSSGDKFIPTPRRPLGAVIDLEEPLYKEERRELVREKIEEPPKIIKKEERTEEENDEEGLIAEDDSVIIKCDLCDSVFNNEDALNIHKEFVHEKKSR